MWFSSDLTQSSFRTDFIPLSRNHHASKFNLGLWLPVLSLDGLNYFLQRFVWVILLHSNRHELTATFWAGCRGNWKSILQAGVS
jgi:hypothetical protein